MGIIAKKRKRDGITIFMIDFRDQKGRRVRENAGTTRTQAKDLLTKRLGQVRAGTYINLKEKAQEADRGPTFAEFCQRFLREHPGRRRSNHYPASVKRLQPYLEGRFIRDITRADLDQLRIRLQTEIVKRTGRPLNSTSVVKLLRVLHRIFKQAVRWGVLAYNPAADLEKPPIPVHRTRYLNREDLAALQEHAPAWLKPMLSLAVATGMRLKEITKLRWDDIDKAAKLLHVAQDTKTRTRVIPLNASALKVLEAQVHRLQVSYVFTTSTGDHFDHDFSRSKITKHTISAMKAAGIHDATFHTLRHTAASLMVQAGVPLFEVQKILGHSTPAMTVRYGHLAPHHLRGAVDALDRALSGDQATSEIPATKVSTQGSKNAVDTQMDTSGSTPSQSLQDPKLIPCKR